MKQTFSEHLHRGLHGVNELLMTVRELCLMVAVPATVPESFQMHRWAGFQLHDLRLSAGRESQMYRTFEAHRGYYTCGGEYREAVTVVEEFLITVAINLLRMPQVADQVNMALSCWCPDVLMRGSVSEMQETIGYFLEALERNGVVAEEERTRMSESYVQFVRHFRDDHTDEYVSDFHENELLQYGANDVTLRRMMQLSLCLRGSVNQNINMVSMSFPVLPSEPLLSIFRKIRSWCVARGVRSLHSIPVGLVMESSEAVGRIEDLRSVTLESLWGEVGRESPEGSRDAVLERLGFNAEGGRTESSEIGGEHRF